MFDHTLSFAILFGVATGAFSCALAVAASVLLSRGKSFWIVIAFCFFASLGLGFVAFRRFVRAIVPLETGLHGERAVAFVLKDLERQGYFVFHDVPSLHRPEEANIDHVVIGPSGVYAIETKTIRKRDGQRSLEFTGEHLTIDGKNLPLNPLPQARAVSDDLKSILERFAGESCNIQPVIALPGWYVTSRLKPWKQPVWVVNENALVSLITHPYRPTLPDDIARRLTGALQAHIRATNATKV